MRRTHANGDLRMKDVNTQVCLSGWVSKRRNFGSLVFIDLRDRSGIIQLVFHEEKAKEIVDVRNECVLEIQGKVVERKDKNPNILTGDIEIEVSDVKIINYANTTPLIIADETDALEDTRLKYRYLDLRRPILQNNLMLRHQVTLSVRNYLSSQGFIEIETPILCKSTPEGARDYLVPSRIYPGSFYALPQSPQIYKQLLMIAGMDKYFQIARCFRDEDLRADRQPEFSQIDIEMSFVEEEDVFALTEGLMKHIFKEVKNVTLQPFQRLTYEECMEMYGSDKPDLRFALPLKNVTSIFQNTIHPLIKNALEAEGIVQAIKISNKADQFSRKSIDKLQEHVQIYQAKALLFIKYTKEEITGSIAKNLLDQEKQELIDVLQLQENDIVFFIADKKKIAQTALGALRLKIAQELDLIQDNMYQFLWVTNFPMFEYDEQEKRYVAAHHPFTSPNIEDVDKLKSDPKNCYSRAYDLVLNGYELLSGSIRIHSQEIQEKVFEAIGMTMEQAKDKFGFFLDAFQYGTPPHGGVGIGLERLLMILANTDNIRDVVAFPKTASASDLMCESPNPVDEYQLQELAIDLKK